jgi:hypothetical protein
VIDDDNSSVADATDCTLVEASSDAAATAVVSCCERSAVADSVPAEVELRRGRGYGLHDLADRTFKLRGELDHVGLALPGEDLV